MKNFNPFARVSASPTKPKSKKQSKAFDIADLYEGPFGQGETPSNAENALGLDEKLRQAYFWIVNNAIISPHYDIEFHTKAPQQYRTGTAKA